MLILPAIDLFKGEVVRLKQGDYSQMTVYSSDPVSVARGFRDDGATHMHVVDLEGARDGVPKNFDVIERIAKESGLEVQVGGGVRTAETVERYIKIGVRRVILGTAAVQTPGFAESMVRKHGDAVAVSVDIKDGLVAVRGWTKVSDKDALGFCRTVEELGVQTLICTDISKDGLLAGTNMELYRTLRERLAIKLVASGGVTTLDEVRALKALGINGVILGKSLYTGRIKLSDAVNAAKEAPL